MLLWTLAFALILLTVLVFCWPKQLKGFEDCATLGTRFPIVGQLPKVISLGFYNYIGALAKLARNTDEIATVWIFGKPMVFVFDPKLIASVYSRTDTKFNTPGFDALFPRAMLVMNGEEWKHRRRLQNPNFTLNKLKLLTPTIAHCGEKLLRKWQSKARQGLPVDVSTDFTKITLDVLTQSIFSVDIGAFSETDDAANPLCTALNLVLVGANKRLVNPFLFLDRKYDRAHALAKETAKSIIVKRREVKNVEDSSDLLSLLMSTIDPHTGKKLPDEDVIDECLVFLIAGHETTSILLMWTAFLLSRYPDVQQKLRQEVDAIAESRTESSDGLWYPTFDDVRKMSYMLCVFQEAMRIFPPVYINKRSSTKDHPIELKGRVVPHGVDVFFAEFVVARDERYWKNPDEFIPERWERAGLDEQSHGELPPYHPFGGGGRMCIGKAFARDLEARVLMSMIIRHLELHPIRGEEHIKEPEILPEITLRPKRPICLQVRERAF